MIRHIGKMEINSKLINNEILKKYINSIILILNKAKQLEYCYVHKTYIKKSLNNIIETVNNNFKEIMNIYYIKNLLCVLAYP